jgi:choline-sulfatase
MLAALDRAGLAGDTIVLFTSDHGDNLGSHGLVQKGGPTEEAIRIPWMVRAPGRLAPTVVTSHVASLADIAPTLLSLVGLRAPEHMQGRDLSQVMGADGRPARQEPRPPAAHAIVETSGGLAVRTPRHMAYVPFEAGTRRLAPAATMLYDLDADPYQFANLVEDAAYAGVSADLVALLRDWDRETPWL